MRIQWDNMHSWNLLGTQYFSFLFFRAVLDSQQNWGEGTLMSPRRRPFERLHYTPVPFHTQSPPSSTSPTRVVHLLQLMEWEWHPSHPKSIAYPKVHSWSWAFSVSGQMYNDIHPSWYHAEYFNCPKNPLCSAYSSIPPHDPLQWLYCYHILPFSVCHLVGITQYVLFFHWLLSLSRMHWRFFHVP